MIKLTVGSMDSLWMGGKLYIATYSCRVTSSLLTMAKSAEVLVGYFKETDSHLVGAVMMADRYPHIKVRLLKDSHRKYCLSKKSKVAYIGSSNLAGGDGELGVLIKDKELFQDLVRIHENLWKRATPVKRSPTQARLVDPSQLLKAML